MKSQGMVLVIYVINQETIHTCVAEEFLNTHNFSLHAKHIFPGKLDRIWFSFSTWKYVK